MNFFSEHAWLDLQTLNEFRRDAPILSPPMGWRPVQVPESNSPESWGYDRVLSHRHRVGSG